MKLEIKLKDPEHCDGCPCFRFDGMFFFCSRYGGFSKPFEDKGNIKRQAICIKENGR